VRRGFAHGGTASLMAQFGEGCWLRRWLMCAETGEAWLRPRWDGLADGAVRRGPL